MCAPQVTGPHTCVCVAAVRMQDCGGEPTHQAQMLTMLTVLCVCVYLMSHTPGSVVLWVVSHVDPQVQDQSPARNIAWWVPRGDPSCVAHTHTHTLGHPPTTRGDLGDGGVRKSAAEGGGYLAQRAFLALRVCMRTSASVSFVYLCLCTCVSQGTHLSTRSGCTAQVTMLRCSTCGSPCGAGAAGATPELDTGRDVLPPPPPLVPDRGGRMKHGTL